MFDPILLLCLGGTICFLMAILHVVIIIAGPKAYRYFGAGEELASLAEKQSAIPALLTAFIATVLAIFGLYAFAGAGKFTPLPFLEIVLIIIGSIFCLRGLAIPVQLYQLLKNPHRVEYKEIVFSLISLLAGFCFMSGLIQNWAFISSIS